MKFYSLNHRSFSIAFFSFTTLALSFLSSCYPEEDKDPDCIGEETPCRGFDFSFVDAETYENLMGTDGQLIHPDTMFILNMQGDTMAQGPYYGPRYGTLTEWWNVGFSPYQELNCFNQCTLDSAFSRSYYIYTGNQDWDTLEIHFPAKTEYATVMEVTFNNMDARVPEGVQEYASYYFRK
mgnify:CR=1 FL=1